MPVSYSSDAVRVILYVVAIQLAAATPDTVFRTISSGTRSVITLVDSCIFTYNVSLNALLNVYLCKYGFLRDSLVGIATPYGLDRRGEVLRSCPDCHGGGAAFSLLQNGYQVSFPGEKQPVHGDDHLPPSCAQVKEREELYF